jgi:phage terminase large subunit-like protein
LRNPRSTDPKAVAMKVAELHGLCNIKALAYDRWRIEDFKRELDAIGCNVEVIAFGQGYKDLSPAVDRVERLVEEGKLRHDNHPVLWMAAANAKVEMDAAGNRKLSKRKSTGRIDPCCIAMAVGGVPSWAGNRYQHADCLTDGKWPTQHKMAAPARSCSGALY